MGPTTVERTSVKQLVAVVVLGSLLQGCATAVAVADVTVSAVIYSAKTVVNVVDAVTPDIVNRDRPLEDKK